MTFVASKFPLPTVSRPDGTLQGYVRMSPSTSSPVLRWPDERLKIYQAQLAAAAAAKKKPGWFGLGDTPAPSTSPVPIGPALSPADVAAGNIDAATLWQMGIQQAIDLRKNKSAAPPTSPATSPAAQPAPGAANVNSGASWLSTYAPWIAGAAGLGLVIYAARKSSGPRTGRPIAGAHVYEGL